MEKEKEKENEILAENLTEFIEKKKALERLENGAQKIQEDFKAKIKKHETELLELEVNIKT